MVIGITGNIASGKSSAARILKEMVGGIVIDADSIGHHLLENNVNIQYSIKSEFGNDVLDSMDRIDRNKLGKIVFSDAYKLNVLNKIFFPYITRELYIETHKAQGIFQNIIVDAALIIEWNIVSEFDKLIVVAANKDIRLKRLMEYRRLLEEDAIERIEAQAPEELKIEVADVVVYNNKTTEDLYKDLEHIVGDLSFA